MNQYDDPEAMFRTAMPEAPPPSADLDLDRIVSDGYRSRRRHRALIGGAATTGVAAVAAVLALTAVGLPGDPTDDPTNAVPPAAEEGSVEDASMSGYPYAPNEEFGGEEERALLHEGAVAAFKPLLDQVGVVLTDDVPLEFTSNQTPGNYGQTWLRSFTTGASNAEESGEDEDVVFRLEAMLPGGWTAEPGPNTEQVFPQHLISASGSPWYDDADWTDEVKITDRDNGRTLLFVDHECALEAAVVYANGSALRGSWDMGCHEGSPEYEISNDDFIEAMLAMPEVDYDTSGLSPVGELLDVPVGWTYDPEWDAAASEDANASIAAALDALQTVVPGATLEEAAATQLGFSEYGAVNVRTYDASGSLPYDSVTDETNGSAMTTFAYVLPGGWVPGISESGTRGPEQANCMEGFTCSTTTDDDGTVWAFESIDEALDEEALGGSESEASEHQLRVTRFDPDGWAATMWVRWGGDLELEADLLADILRAVPEPVYDAEATPQIPAD